jgi:hypothetical protein
MSKKKSTTVKTGLGDQQYDTITSNQQSIASSVDTGFNNAAAVGADLQAGQGTITSNQQTLSDGQPRSRLYRKQVWLPRR